MKKTNGIIFLMVFVSIFFFSTVNAAEPKPGDIINSQNIDQYKEFFPYFMQEFIKDGWDGAEKPPVIHVEETENWNLTKGQAALAKKNVGKVTLDKDGYLVGHENGVPFLEPKEPEKALKILWSRYYRQNNDDAFCKDDFYNVSKRGKAGRVSVGKWAIANMYFSSRTDVDPKPVYPNNNGLSRGYISQSNVPPARGLTMLMWRYTDISKTDDMWNYIPTLRRTLRMLSSERANPLYGSITTLDDGSGFDGRVPDFTPKLIGEKKMLVLAHLKEMPAEAMAKKGYTPPPILNGAENPFQLVTVYEMELRPKKDPRYPIPKKIIWINKSNYICYYMQAWDKSGGLWKVAQMGTTKQYYGNKGPDEWLLSNVYQTTIDVKNYGYNMSYWGPMVLNTGMDPNTYTPGTFFNSL